MKFGLLNTLGAPQAKATYKAGNDTYTYYAPLEIKDKKTGSVIRSYTDQVTVGASNDRIITTYFTS